MQTFKNDPTAAPRIKANARKRNSEMDDSTIKSPTIVMLVHVESNAVHEKQLPLVGVDAISILSSAASICANVISVAGDSCVPPRRVNLCPPKHQSISILPELI